MAHRKASFGRLRPTGASSTGCIGSRPRRLLHAVGPGHKLAALLVIAGVLALGGELLAYVGYTFRVPRDRARLWATLRVFAATSPPVAQLVLGYASGYALAIDLRLPMVPALVSIPALAELERGLANQ